VPGGPWVFDIELTPRPALHFNLSIPNYQTSTRTTSFEDTEFTYAPRLEAGRDRDLLQILPDYLAEEISFSRINAAKFYARVVDTLIRKIGE
jgi:hypothetical protein